MLFRNAQRIKVMVTVKAYPQVSKKYTETVCVAGIRLDTDEPRHVRLFPVPFRDMEQGQQFNKYDIIELDAVQHESDKRPESMRPDLQSLRIIGHASSDNGWRDRAHHVRPLVVQSLCEIKRRQQAEGTSLGVFRPKSVDDFRLEPAEAWTSHQEMLADQGHLWDPERKRLEKPPFKFMYRFRCDDTTCKGHRMGIIDWEVGAAFFSWRAKYGDAEIASRMRGKWLDEVASTKRDLHFFVGNQEQYPKTFMLLGVFWPPRYVMDQGPLF